MGRPTKLLSVALASLVACAAAGTAPAHAAGRITIGPDGTSAPVFSYDKAIRERVYIPQAGVDQDADGADDRIAIEIMRPQESRPDLPVPAIIDPSPYYTTVCRGNEGECIADTDHDGVNDDFPLFLDNYFVPRGYAVILAESDGTGNGTGCPLHGGPGDVASERSVIDWLNGRVPGYTTLTGTTPVLATWHNGSSAMIGKSYDGTFANGVAATGVAGLKTVVPISAISDWYKYSRQNGLRFNTHYPANLSGNVTNTDRQALCKPTRDALSLLDGDATGDVNPFWTARNYLKDASRVKAAVFLTHGLQDDNVKLDHLAEWWAALGRQGVPRKLWLLREGHVDPFDSRRAVWVDTLHRWFDHWLLDVDNGIMSEPPVDIEDAPDQWNRYASWPVPGSEDTDVYLRGTTALAAGALGLSSGGDVDAVSFQNSATPAQSETDVIATPTGAQTARRVFLSPPLKRDLRLSGTPKVQLDATLSSNQSNLAAVITDYGEGTQIVRDNEGIANTTDETCWGESRSGDHHDACYFEVTKPTRTFASWRVSRGVLDSSNRSSLTTPSDVTPGTETAFDWPLIPSDYVFKAGHQIAITVVGDYPSLTSSQLSRNPNTTVTVDTKASKVTLPFVGGYPAAVASGAFARDVVAPAISVSGDVTASATGPEGAAVTYPLASATDDEDPNPTTACLPASGSTFPAGPTTVTCTAQDQTGNERRAQFTVTVARTGGAGSGQGGQLPAPAAPATPDRPTPVSPAPVTGPVAPAPTRSPSLAEDEKAPGLGTVRLSQRARVARARFWLSERARVTVSIRRQGAHRALRTVSGRYPRGSRAVSLSGARLRKGRYVVTIRAVDADGNVTVTRRTLRVRR